MGEMDLSSGHCGWPDEAWPPPPGASLARPLPDSESCLGKATYCLGPLGPAWDVGHDHALAWLRTTVLSRGAGRGWGGGRWPTTPISAVSRLLGYTH